MMHERARRGAAPARKYQRLNCGLAYRRARTGYAVAAESVAIVVLASPEVGHAWVEIGDAEFGVGLWKMVGDDWFWRRTCY